METLSFVLGMSLVVVIALAVVAVIAFVKIIKLEKGVSDRDRDIEDMNERVYQELESRTEKIYRDMNDSVGHLTSIIDSRCDKLDTKINGVIIKK